MSLYEVVFNYTGESFVRCYVWCESESDAVRMAARQAEMQYRDKAYGISDVKLCFNDSSTPFVTPLSDCGFEAPTVSMV